MWKLIEETMELDEKYMEVAIKSTEGEEKSTEHYIFFIKSRMKMYQACQFF